MASLITQSWNPLIDWLQKLAALRDAVGLLLKGAAVGT